MPLHVIFYRAAEPLGSRLALSAPRERKVAIRLTASTPGIAGACPARPSCLWLTNRS